MKNNLYFTDNRMHGHSLVYEMALLLPFSYGVYYLNREILYEEWHLYKRDSAI